MIATNYYLSKSYILYPHLDVDGVELGPFSSTWLKFIPAAVDNCQKMIWECSIYDFVYTSLLSHTQLPLPNSRFSDEN